MWTVWTHRYCIKRITHFCFEHKHTPDVFMLMAHTADNVRVCVHAILCYAMQYAIMLHILIPYTNVSASVFDVRIFPTYSQRIFKRNSPLRTVKCVECLFPFFSRFTKMKHIPCNYLHCHCALLPLYAQNSKLIGEYVTLRAIWYYYFGGSFSSHHYHHRRRRRHHHQHQHQCRTGLHFAYTFSRLSIQCSSD